MNNYKAPKCMVCGGTLFVKMLTIQDEKLKTWNCNKCNLQLKYIVYGGEEVAAIKVGKASVIFPTNSSFDDVRRIKHVLNILAGKYDNQILKEVQLND